MNGNSRHVRWAACIVSALAGASAPYAQVGTVQSEQKISQTTGGFGGTLHSADHFAPAAALGDLNGDGIGDLAVGAPEDDDGGSNRGAVWILFLNANGTVQTEQKISETSGGFGGTLYTNDFFGSSVASLGDLDGDGIGDLAVGAILGDVGGPFEGNVWDQGAVWILFLNADGTVKAEQKIAEATGGFAGILASDDRFGVSVASLGDLDGDGVGDLAVGASQDGDGGGQHGAVWILFLHEDGTVRSEQKISDTSGGFGGVGALFGQSVASLGDLNGDGIGDLAVGAPYDTSSQGAVWILFLNADGSVRAEQKISETDGGFGGALDPGDLFGWSVSSLRDLDCDGIGDLAVGAPYDDDGGADRGAGWILFLNDVGTVHAKQKISETSGGFGGVLDNSDHFGFSVASLGDLDGDHVRDLAVGAEFDDDGGSANDNFGAVWILFLEGPSGPDLVPPTIACPIAVSACDGKTAAAGAVVSFSVTATDCMDPAPSVVCVPPPGSFFPHGTTIVTCTATDASGNQSVCMFPVVVMSALRPHPSPGPVIRHP